jgi:hypothetical protein
MAYSLDNLSSMKNKYSPLPCLWTEVAETKENCKNLEMTSLFIFSPSFLHTVNLPLAPGLRKRLTHK